MTVSRPCPKRDDDDEAAARDDAGAAMRTHRSAVAVSYGASTAFGDCLLSIAALEPPANAADAAVLLASQAAALDRLDDWLAAELPEGLDWRWLPDDRARGAAGGGHACAEWLWAVPAPTAGGASSAAAPTALPSPARLALPWALVGRQPVALDLAPIGARLRWQSVACQLRLEHTPLAAADVQDLAAGAAVLLPSSFGGTWHAELQPPVAAVEAWPGRHWRVDLSDMSHPRLLQPLESGAGGATPLRTGPLRADNGQPEAVLDCRSTDEIGVPLAALAGWSCPPGGLPLIGLRGAVSLKLICPLADLTLRTGLGRLFIWGDGQAVLIDQLTDHAPDAHAPVAAGAQTDGATGAITADDGPVLR